MGKKKKNGHTRNQKRVRKISILSSLCFPLPSLASFQKKKFVWNDLSRLYWSIDSGRCVRCSLQTTTNDWKATVCVSECPHGGEFIGCGQNRILYIISGRICVRQQSVPLGFDP